jgi:CRISPR-associated endonuclease/helicase Cas3
MPLAYPTFYHQRTGHPPHPWQAELAADWRCRDRLIRVPTGMGKTLGVLGAWAFHRLGRADPAWPRRLVLCLPMRVLVEQTEAVVRDFLAGMARLDDPAAPAPGRVGVHLLLGGAATRDWHAHPEQEAVLIGTQDMLLSRALNRGYAAPRARWPMESALLRQDALWVLDEVQLMDVGLRTAVQLQAFHPPREVAPARPLVSWWMSATLQPTWLHTVDFGAHLPALEATSVRIPPEDRRGPLFAAQKPLGVHDLPRDNDRDAAAWARLVLEEHQRAEGGDYGRITLAIANTVDDARALFAGLQGALKKNKAQHPTPELRLIHSRFRPHERSTWRDQFLNREACKAGVDRILVATQVVEAGVDISATALVTQLAPWPSLVQRFGRAARYGGLANVTVVDRHLSERAALPYREDELSAARRVLDGLTDVGLSSLEALEDRLAASDPAQLARLYPYDPLHTLTRRDLDDLFDTGPDLTGSDLDVSRFIRSGDDRDLHVWWVDLAPNSAPGPDLQPTRAALCAVPIKDAGAWLIGKDAAQGLRAWIWSYLQGAWLPVKNERELTPGRLVLVDAAAGGYTPESGFVGALSRAPVQPVPTQPPTHKPTLEQSLLHADSAQDHEDLSELAPQGHYKTIAFHGYEAAQEAEQLAAALDLPAPFPDLLKIAARLHDLGKAHPVFQAAIAKREPPALNERTDLAKAPNSAWSRPPYPRNKGFRHELASVLALFEALYQAAPAHPALLGPFAPMIESGALFSKDEIEIEHLHATHPAPTGVLAELLALPPSDLDLVLYLVCAHHGKIRGTWQPTPDDQKARPDAHNNLPLRGVQQNDRFPATLIADAAGTAHLLPELHLHLDPARLGLSPRYGASWRERVHALRGRLGDPFLLLLESLLRVADVRASIRTTVDPTLTP